MTTDLHCSGTGNDVMNDLFTKKLSDGDFSRVVRLVEESVGIHLPEHKRSMTELRLARRARVLGLSSLDEYCAFVFDGGGASVEQVSLIDALTTNKTDFFREAEHFELLNSQVVPSLRGTAPGIRSGAPLKVWSAGCSTGEEPYSIAMVLADYARQDESFDFLVHATDVSSTALQHAVRGVYSEERVCPVPVELRRRYLLRHKDHSKGLVRIAPEIRAKIRFARHNLFLASPPVGDVFDVIFCRNVIIYFERDNQIKVLSQMLASLAPGGYLFVGHSETLHGMPLPLQRAGTTLYRKDPA